jgi:hypothetical protein
MSFILPFFCIFTFHLSSHTSRPLLKTDESSTMPHSRSWFSANAAGKTVSLSEPLDTTWEIVAKINERVEQYSDTKQLSIASAKFLVHHVDAPPDKGIAYMRVIKQIPSVLAEGTDDSSRGREAKQFVPSELNAYHALMRKHSHNTPHLFAWETGEQEDSGQVPGGSITYIVFEKLPGIALGTEFRATAFWEQPPATRELIRRTLFVEYK